MTGGSPLNGKELLEYADKNLYQAKKSGRNCVVAFDAFNAPKTEPLMFSPRRPPVLMPQGEPSCRSHPRSSPS